MSDIQDIDIKKGTTTVGMVCADGIVLAADKRVTLGGQIVSHKKFEKVVKINDNMAVAMAGNVSDAQLIIKLIKAELRLRQIRTNQSATVKETANLLAAIVYQNIRKFSVIPGITAFILGGVDPEGYWLYDIGVDGSVVIHDEYTTVGSGFMMAYGVLDTLYNKKNMKVQDAVTLAVKAINAAIQRDTATGEGIDVVTITKEGVKKVMTQQLETRLTV